jgi:hypothetical protein
MAAATTALTMPAVAVVVAAAWALAAMLARVRRARHGVVRNLADLASLCDLTTIGLTGGLGVRPALEMAVAELKGDLAAELDSLLRKGRVDGIAAVMTTADGVGRRFYRIVGRAAATGSSLLDSVSRLAHDLRAETAAAELEAVRRLPVTMLFPLTMLILPGFLLLAVAPGILDAIGRLDFAP